MVLPYINADPVLAKRLQDVGTATVMPLGAPIGSNRGIQTRDQIRIILEQATVPVVVDAGLGAPSHAAEAMELGADAVLVNTAIAIAPDPSGMARAFALAVQAGRMAGNGARRRTDRGERHQSPHRVSRLRRFPPTRPPPMASLVSPSFGLLLTPSRVRAILRAAARRRVLVVGDLMLDQFIWGGVRRISPEAPVPVVEFQRESYMAGGAANVARNLTALGATTELFGVVGEDHAAGHLAEILRHDGVGCDGLLAVADRPTGLKTRVIASQQHVVRIDRERRGPLPEPMAARLVALVVAALDGADAVLVGDYGKGVVSQELLDVLRRECRARGVWMSLDPKPVNGLDLGGVFPGDPEPQGGLRTGRRRGCGSRRKSAGGCSAGGGGPVVDPAEAGVAAGDPGSQGMLLCRKGHRPFHIPTVAREVFDVSGAGDTVIAAFTLAIAAGARPWRPPSSPTTPPGRGRQGRHRHRQPRRTAGQLRPTLSHGGRGAARRRSRSRVTPPRGEVLRSPRG